MPVPNADIAVIPAGTTQSKTVTIETNGARELVVITNVTAQTGNVTVTILGVSAEGVTWTILAGSAISSVTNQELRVSPELTAAANATAKDIVPDIIQIQAVVAGGTATYSVDASLGS